MSKDSKISEQNVELPAPSKDVIDEFCSRAHSAFEAWCLTKFFLTQEKYFETQKHHDFAYFFYWLRQISQHYWLLQLSKLQDPASNGKKENLSLEYMVKDFSWKREDREKLESLKTEMDKFFENIKPARDQIICHTDRKIAMSEEPLGGFSEGDDEKYFDDLKRFAKVMYDAIGEPLIFFETRYAKDDAESVMLGLTEYLECHALEFDMLRSDLGPADLRQGVAANIRSMVVRLLGETGRELRHSKADEKPAH